MKRRRLLLLSLFAVICATMSALPRLDKVTATNDDESLSFGYINPWTAKLLYNPGRNYDQSWPQLCKAGADDSYDIELPYTTGENGVATVMLKTPITLVASHRYTLKMRLRLTAGVTLGTSISLVENENTSIEAASQWNRLSEGSNIDVTINNITRTDISDMALRFEFFVENPSTKLTLSQLSLVDNSYGNRELWQDGVFYVQSEYLSGSTRMPDPIISGLHETMEWTSPDFDDTQWSTALMPIGNWGYIPEVNTIWQGGDYNNYWIRRTFTLNEVKSTTQYVLDVLHDDTYKIYVNGHLIDEADDWTDGYNALHFEIPWQFLQVGKNVIAVYQQQNWGGKFFDVGLTITPNAYEEYDDIDPAKVLVANEIQVANIDQYIDYSFNYGGWVELYNTSDKTVNLGGLYVSDDPADLMKFIIPNRYGVIKPKGYGVLYFDHNSADGEYGETADRQVRFNLNKDGGVLYISDYFGNPFITLNYPASIARCSYARKQDGDGQWGFTGEPSLGASNNNSDFANIRLDAPQVDTDSKLFTTPFTISVNIPANATLRYTTDGSTPTKTSAISTDGIFKINNTTSLRFRLFRQGYLPSQVVTRSYIYRDRDYYLPVFSITTADENLYGDSIGVYCQGVNGITGHGNNYQRNNLNMDWVRPVNVEYITADNRMVINQEAEFSVSGGWSRLYAPSSFKLKAKKIYEGLNSFDYPFFHDKGYNKYKELLVRNGGNDNDSPSHGRIKDAIIQQTISSSGIYVDCQSLQPTHVFFNGQYIGMLNLREPSNKYFGTANYGYDKDYMDAFEFSNGYFQKAGDKAAYNEWIALASRSQEPEVYQQLRKKVDLDEFINFMSAITWIGSSDWICNNNNLKGFRTKDDGRFHLVLFDVDWGFSNSQALTQILNSNANDMIGIFKNSLKNETLRRQFIDSYSLMGGSVFTPKRVQETADSLAYLMEKALSFDDKQPWSSYNELVPNMVSTSRNEDHINALRNNFGLGDGMKVKFQANIPEARLQLNGLDVPLNKFDGTLFAPLTLSTTAPAGYDFVGWERLQKSTESIIPWASQWYYWDQGSQDGTDWKTLTSRSGWTSGNTPIGYGKSDITTQTTYNLPCYYFRKAFIVNNKPQEGEEFVLNYVADDGFIVYVNGTEVARYLMPAGDVNYNTFATTYAPNNPDRGTISIDASYFKRGTNVIAVEVHNNKLASTDIYWNAELLYMRSQNETISTERNLYLAEDNDQELIARFEPIADEYLNYAGSTPVVINEISAGNSVYVNEYYKKNDWIELYNTTSEPIDVSGMYLSDNESNPQKFQITRFNVAENDSPLAQEEPTVIPPHGYLVIWADKLDPMYQLHASFKLGNNDGEYVILTAEDGSWSDRLDYNSHTGEESVGRYPDGGKRVFKMTRPTIAATNQLTTYAEWLYGEDVNFDPSVINGIEVPNDTDSEVVSKQYYSIDGRLLAAPQTGVNIVRMTHADGTITTKKIIRR